jgi:preprotein translocase subunit SecA
MFSFLSKLIPNKNLNRLKAAVLLINERESEVEKLSDLELKETSLKLKERVQNSGDKKAALDGVLPEAFALVREAARRTLKQRHFDVQLMGGLVLHQGKVAQMFTGEGKTLVATLPTYLNALAGEGVHVITVNDYLARRDVGWMGQVYDALGLKVSCLVHDAAYAYDPEFRPQASDEERDVTGSYKVAQEFLRPINRKEAYAADITYGTNHEFGFDYLRDNLALELGQKVQRPPAFAIIDEVDSILIDEARTPLIISAPDVKSSEFYKIFTRVVEKLEPETDYTVDEKLKAVSLTEEGIEKVEKQMGLDNIFSSENNRMVHYLQESLKAKALFRRDKEYVVKNNEIIIVDEFTGRMLQGRRYSGGLHQAIEAKEGVLINDENRTYAQVTIQNYFRLYKKIAGMTGTAETSAEEFHKVYGLEVVAIPSNKILKREDLQDLVYKNKEAKYRAVAQDVKKRQDAGQPVLLGTTSIENNEIISAFLSREGIQHEVLNAKNNEREGAIIAQAGRKGAVTVATNMAGRGVDIILGGQPYNEVQAEEVRALGGLCVIGTERHEARRIDNQLRGRAGRQGDPGASRFFLSLEDDLLRIFGGERIERLMKMMDYPEDMPIESKMVSKAVNQAQSKVEGANFDARKHLLEFDDVLNKQRSAIYSRRAKFLEAGEKGDIRQQLLEVLQNFVDRLRKMETLPGHDENIHKFLEEGEARLNSLPEVLTPEQSLIAGRHLTQIQDMLWVEHLESLEELRNSVNIRAYAQHEPLTEYRREAHRLYNSLQQAFEELVFRTVFEALKAEPKQPVSNIPPAVVLSADGNPVGRNDMCPCGSGKKYKRCHGA